MIVFAIIPGHFYWRHGVSSRKTEFQGAGLGEEQRIVAIQSQWSDFCWETQFQELVESIHDVGSPIAESTHAKIIPTPPLTLNKVAMIAVRLGCHEPGVPIKGFRDGLSFRKICHAGVPTMPATPTVHVGCDFFYAADQPIFRPSLELIVIILTVSLIPHLSGHAIPRGSPHQQFGFPKGASQRLFDIDMLAQGHGQHGYRKVREVRCPDSHRVDLIGHAIKHLSKILKSRLRIKGLEVVQGVRPTHVHIAESHNISESCLMHGSEITTTLIADAAARQPHFFIRCLGSRLDEAALVITFC